MTQASTPLALVTGASSGIGLEFARVHASRGGDLCLVARSSEKLEALKQELESAHGITATVVAKDLSLPGAAAELLAETSAAGLEVGVLINNAGFGGHGKFVEQELAAHQRMMQVNMVALTELCHAYLPAMVERGAGRVLNVSSTAGFMPGPLQAVYYATKAYVTNLSQALANEVEEAGVTVTALCPGAVDTGFVAAGNLDGLELFEGAKSPESVAAFGYAAMERGDLVAINEPGLAFQLNWLIPLLPRRMVLKMSRQFMEKG